MKLLNKIKNHQTSDEKSSTLNFENEFIKPIFNDILKYSPYKLVALILNIITVPIYTMFLSPSDYGLYAISIALSVFFRSAYTVKFVPVKIHSTFALIT